MNIEAITGSVAWKNMACPTPASAVSMRQRVAADAPSDRIIAADPVGLVTCPLCHTPDTVVTSEAASSGADWRCSRCGQLWDRTRLANVAAYSASLRLRAMSVASAPESLA